MTTMTNKQSTSLFQSAVKKIISEKLSLAALIIVLIYFGIALLTWLGFLANDWGKEVAGSYAEPSGMVWFGADIFGRSVALKVIAMS
jgi:peptide/nickel transport system permease protein